MNIKVMLDEDAYMPTKAHKADAGFDLYATRNYQFARSVLIDTGVRIQIPQGYVGLILPRSSMSKKYFITFTGVIDSGYTGSIKVALFNLEENFTDDRMYEKTVRTIKKGDRIAQLVITPLLNADLLKGDFELITERGFGGFGSSGT